MKYPDKIYGKFEVIEKQIAGETCYGVIQESCILGIKIKRQRKVRVNSWDSNLGSFNCGEQKWCLKKDPILDAISCYQRSKEWAYEKKVLKK